MDSTLFNLLLPTLFALIVASRGFSIDDDYVRGWADSAGVQLDEVTGPTVRRSLLRSRRARTLGGLVGFLAPLFYLQLATGSVRGGGWSLLLMFVGYLLGALFAAAVTPRGIEGGALLVRRRLEDYLPRYVLILQRGLGLVCVAGSVAYAVVYAAVDSVAYSVPSPLAVVGFGLGGAGIAMVTEALQRSIVRRRQVAASEDQIAVDDAMRSSALHVIAGAGLALLWIFAGGQVGVIAAVTGTVGGFVGLAVLVLTTAAAFSFWRDLSRPQGFRVRRRIRRRMPA